MCTYWQRRCRTNVMLFEPENVKNSRIADVGLKGQHHMTLEGDNGLSNKTADSFRYVLKKNAIVLMYVWRLDVKGYSLQIIE